MIKHAIPAAVLLAALGCGPNWDALDPSLGGAHGSSSTTHTTGTGGQSGAKCSSPFQCPGSDTTCSSRTCTAGTCGVQNAPSGTHCGPQGGTRKCDGMGNCL